jgi:hypothetical protein
MARVSSLLPLQIDMDACDAKEQEDDQQSKEN